MLTTRLNSPVRKAAGAILGTLVLTAALAGCGTKDYDEENDAETRTSADADRPTTCSYEEAGPSAGKDVRAPSDSPVYEGTVEATIVTSVGDIEVTLDADGAPCTVNSFASLADQGYFDDTTCHRIIGGFMIQCGDPSASGTGGPGYSYADELSGDEEYGPGTLAMANSGPDTNGSQFFIVSGDASHLTTHTVFGQVTEESLEIIRDVDTSWSGGDNIPVDIETVTITS